VLKIEPAISTAKEQQAVKRDRKHSFELTSIALRKQQCTPVYVLRT
jgi:hypothetical protein